MAVDKKLKSIRDEIDSIDEEILSLINERAKFAMQAGEAKVDAATGEPRCFPKEEVIAAMIGIPIPAMSITVANDIILSPPFIFIFFFIK